MQISTDCMFYRGDIPCQPHGVQWRLEGMEDLDITLQLLRHEYKNHVSYHYAQGQARGSQTEGGCSSYRDRPFMERCAYALAEPHPRFGRIVKRQTKCARWGGERTDVTVLWK